MKTVLHIEDLDDIRSLQNQKKANSNLPTIGAIVIDTGALRVFVDHEDVQHPFTPSSLIKLMAEQCGIEVVVK